jgi:hypothetical protein
MERELAETLEKVDVDALQVALREQTRSFNNVQRMVKKKETEVKKCYDNLTTLATDFQLVEIVPSEIATTEPHESSGGRSSANSGE